MYILLSSHVTAQKIHAFVMEIAILHLFRSRKQRTGIARITRKERWKLLFSFFCHQRINHRSLSFSLPPRSNHNAIQNISAREHYYYICIGVSERSALIKKSTWMIHFSSNSPPCERKKVMEKSWDRKLMCMYGSGAHYFSAH